MIIPSIDLLGGQAVQLVGGKTLAVEAGDPRPIAEQFRLAGEIAVIDLDKALGSGDNTELIEELIEIAPCRVGGGIRDLESAIRWLDRGAEKIILGTKAVPEILRELPKERVIAALDATHGEVVVEGWQTKTGARVEERMSELSDLVGGFLVTFVEREGRLMGVDLDRVEALAEHAKGAALTIAGGVNTLDEIAAVDALGVDAQVGMALYTHKLSLADCILAPMRAQSPWPTVITDAAGCFVTLGISDAESVTRAVENKAADLQNGAIGVPLTRIELDTERSYLRFHTELDCRSHASKGLRALETTLLDRKQNAPKGSYSKRLFDDEELLRSKLLEEAEELVEASSHTETQHEAADVLFFTLARMVSRGVSLSDVERELDRRARKVTRRPGDAKPRKPDRKEKG